MLRSLPWRIASEFGERPLSSENLKKAGRGEDRQPVAGVIPKLCVPGERFEWLEQSGDFVRGIFLLKRLLQILDQISKSDRVLLILRVMPVGRLIEREAGRLRVGQRAVEIGREWSHGSWHRMKGWNLKSGTDGCAGSYLIRTAPSLPLPAFSDK